MPKQENVNIDLYGLTDIGKVREVNEDHFLIASLRKVMEIEQTSLPRQEQAVSRARRWPDSCSWPTGQEARLPVNGRANWPFRP